METEQSHLKGLVGQDEFKAMLYFLDAMFEGDFENENSKAYKKAKLTFEMLKDRGCKVGEFRDVIQTFTAIWTKSFYQPADIVKLWRDEYSPSCCY